jgi:hypothetical protein
MGHRSTMGYFDGNHDMLRVSPEWPPSRFDHAWTRFSGTQGDSGSLVACKGRLYEYEAAIREQAAAPIGGASAHQQHRFMHHTVGITHGQRRGKVSLAN